MAAHLWNVARDLPEVARFGKQLVFERKLADRKYPSVVVKPRSPAATAWTSMPNKSQTG